VALSHCSAARHVRGALLLRQRPQHDHLYQAEQISCDPTIRLALQCVHLAMAAWVVGSSVVGLVNLQRTSPLERRWTAPAGHALSRRPATVSSGEDSGGAGV